MFNIQEYVQDLVLEGFEPLEARCRAKKELLKRRENEKDILPGNGEYLNVFRALQEKYKR